MKTRRLLQAVSLLFIFSASSQAATFELGSLPNGTTNIGNTELISETIGTYNDQWNFTLGNPAFVGAGINTFDFGIVLPGSEAFIIDSNQTRYDIALNDRILVLDNPELGPIELGGALTLLNLAAGDYVLHVNLAFESGAGGYDGILSVTSVAPVPEPSTWLLMAAGLGLLTLARKRKA